MYEVLAFAIADEPSRRLARSALPDAPTVPERNRAHRRTIRRGIAVGLHRLAERLQPDLCWPAPRATA